MISTQTNTLGINPHSLLNTFLANRSIQLISVLGVGAYGIVYLGIHMSTNTRCAVKLVAKSVATEREIRLHALVSGHPGILKLENVIREKDWIYLVLEYATDGDLFNTITQQQGFSGRDYVIKYIFLQILDAVQHCHRKGVAHRDLKPENIVLFPNYKVKLADFGLATTHLVSSEFGCGSNFYLSPECQGFLIKNNERIEGYSTHQSDIWSLGVILVNLTTCRNPWRQATMKDQAFAAYIKKPHGFFKTILPGLSDGLCNLLTRIFCIDPARRISLPELRLRVSEMRSFITTDDSACNRTLTIDNTFANIAAEAFKDKAPKKIEYSASILQTMNEYVSDFYDSNGSHEATIRNQQVVTHITQHAIHSTSLPNTNYGTPYNVTTSPNYQLSSSSSRSSCTSSIEILSSPPSMTQSVLSDIINQLVPKGAADKTRANMSVLPFFRHDSSRLQQDGQ